MIDTVELAGNSDVRDARGGIAAELAGDQVRKTPSWPRSRANFSLF